MSTYNRGALLAGAVHSVLRQRECSVDFEVIVVDNNSTDGTRAIVAELAGTDPRLRYVFEPRQGLSHARNAGIRNARADLIAFTDDDVRAEPDWVDSIVRAFDAHTDVDAVGGRVLPAWPAPPPPWLTSDHWAPLAIVDYGDQPIAITADRPLCLLGANFAFRREVFDAVGLFATDFQRVKDRIGSLEDHDFMLRLWRAGRKAVYDPRVTIRAEIQPNRLERAYHRRWHRGHGHFHALLRSPEMEQTRVGTFLGVPAHLYRQAWGDAVGWVGALVAGRPARRFHHEVRLRFFVGFLFTRVGEFLKGRLTPRRERSHVPRTSARRPVPSATSGSSLGQIGR
jgi:glycosyltransferase involved in cell wall biosynthesis